MLKVLEEEYCFFKKLTGMKPVDNKYFAFISYNSKDVQWGKRLQRKLEHYRMPATLCSEKGWERTPIRPVFFAPTDIQPGGLTKEIQDRLRASRHLIVICSPNSAKSEWVGKEIAYFHELGRTSDIHFFIVDGTPHSDDPESECFNPIVKELGLPEILGANINENVFRWRWLNKERAYVQLVSKLLSVEFDSIWKRHRRLLIQKITASVLAFLLTILAGVGVWAFSRPVDVLVRLNELTFTNPYLPSMRDAVVTIELENEIKVDTVRNFETPLIFTNIPSKFINEQVRMKVLADGYFNVDTLTCLKRDMRLDMCRDSSLYGDISFRLWDQSKERFVSDVVLKIADQIAISGEDGLIDLYVPLKDQRQAYHIDADLPLLCDTLFMPCGRQDVIIIQSYE